MVFANFIPFLALQVQILRVFLPLFIINVRDWSFSYERNHDAKCERLCEGYVRDLWGIKIIPHMPQPLCTKAFQAIMWGIIASSIHIDSEQYLRLQWEYCSLTRNWLPVVANLATRSSRPRRFPLLGSYHSAEASSLLSGGSYPCRRAFTHLFGIFIMLFSRSLFLRRYVIFAP